MSNNDKVIYFPHDKEDESKGGIWMPLEQWEMMIELGRKAKEDVLKSMCNLKLKQNE